MHWRTSTHTDHEQQGRDDRKAQAAKHPGLLLDLGLAYFRGIIDMATLATLIHASDVGIVLSRSLSLE